MLTIIRETSLDTGDRDDGLRVLLRRTFGAEEGTRTPTPLRAHGPEPCASANSATSAKVTRMRAIVAPPSRRVIFYSIVGGETR